MSQLDVVDAWDSFLSRGSPASDRPQAQPEARPAPQPTGQAGDVVDAWDSFLTQSAQPGYQPSARSRGVSQYIDNSRALDQRREQEATRRTTLSPEARQREDTQRRESFLEQWGQVNPWDQQQERLTLHQGRFREAFEKAFPGQDSQEAYDRMERLRHLRRRANLYLDSSSAGDDAFAANASAGGEFVRSIHSSVARHRRTPGTDENAGGIVGDDRQTYQRMLAEESTRRPAEQLRLDQWVGRRFAQGTVAVGETPGALADQWQARDLNQSWLRDQAGTESGIATYATEEGRRQEIAAMPWYQRLPTIGVEGTAAAAPAMIAGLAATALGGPQAGLAFWYTQASTSMYDKLRASGVSRDRAAMIGNVAAIPYAFIEQAQVKGIITAAQGATLGRRAMALARTYLSELGEEAAQGGVELVALRVAQALQEDLQVDWKKEFGQSLEELSTAALALPFLMGPNGARSLLRGSGLSPVQFAALQASEARQRAIQNATPEQISQQTQATGGFGQVDQGGQVAPATLPGLDLQQYDQTVVGDRSQEQQTGAFPPQITSDLFPPNMNSAGAQRGGASQAATGPYQEPGSGGFVESVAGGGTGAVEVSPDAEFRDIQPTRPVAQQAQQDNGPTRQVGQPVQDNGATRPGGGGQQQIPEHVRQQQEDTYRREQEVARERELARTQEGYQTKYKTVEGGEVVEVADRSDINTERVGMTPTEQRVEAIHARLARAANSLRTDPRVDARASTVRALRAVAAALDGRVQDAKARNLRTAGKDTAVSDSSGQAFQILHPGGRSARRSIAAADTDAALSGLTEQDRTVVERILASRSSGVNPEYRRALARGYQELQVLEHLESRGLDPDMMLQDRDVDKHGNQLSRARQAYGIVRPAAKAVGVHTPAVQAQPAKPPAVGPGVRPAKDFTPVQGDRTVAPGVRKAVPVPASFMQPQAQPTQPPVQPPAPVVTAPKSAGVKPPAEPFAQEELYPKESAAEAEAKRGPRVKELKGRVEKGLDANEKLSSQQRQSYHRAMSDVIDRMPALAITRLHQAVQTFVFYSSYTTIQTEARKIKPDSEAHAFYRVAEQAVHVDGLLFKDRGEIYEHEVVGGVELKPAVDKIRTLVGLYAHELTHAIDTGFALLDFENHLSHEKGWLTAHDMLQKSDLSGYAKNAIYESFAEFGRLIYGEGTAADVLRTKYPEATAFFEEHGLLPLGGASKVTTLPQILSKPDVDLKKGFLGDVLVGQPEEPKSTGAKVAEPSKPVAPSKSAGVKPKAAKLKVEPQQSLKEKQAANVAKLNPTEGWKLHLATDSPEQVSKALTELGLKHKVGRSGDQSGKDLTVYIGSKDAAIEAAMAIHDKAKNLLKKPHGDALADDAAFNSLVVGRFEVGKTDKRFHQYGMEGKGIPWLAEDVDPWNRKSGGTERADALLKETYGEFYTGGPAKPPPVKSTGVKPAEEVPDARIVMAFKDSHVWESATEFQRQDLLRHVREIMANEKVSAGDVVDWMNDDSINANAYFDQHGTDTDASKQEREGRKSLRGIINASDLTSDQKTVLAGVIDGEKQIELVRELGLTEGRISQILSEGAKALLGKNAKGIGNHVDFLRTLAHGEQTATGKGVVETEGAEKKKGKGVRFDATEEGTEKKKGKVVRFGATEKGARHVKGKVEQVGDRLNALNNKWLKAVEQGKPQAELDAITEEIAALTKKAEKDKNLYRKTAPNMPVSGGGKAAPSRHGIIAAMGEMFQLTQRLGNLAGKAAAMYKTFPQVMRMAGKYAGNLALAAHELAHHLAETTSVTEGLSPALKAELAPLDYDPKLARWQEGFAEYVRNWMTNDAPAAPTPGFDKHFQAWLAANADAAGKLGKLKGMVAEWAGADPVARGLADMRKPGQQTKVEGRSVWQSIKLTAARAIFYVRKRFGNESTKFFEVIADLNRMEAADRPRQEAEQKRRDAERAQLKKGLGANGVNVTALETQVDQLQTAAAILQMFGGDDRVARYARAYGEHIRGETAIHDPLPDLGVMYSAMNKLGGQWGYDAVMNGQFTIKNGKLVRLGKGTKAIFKDAGVKTLADKNLLALYWWATHAIDEHAAGREPGMRLDDATAIHDELKGRFEQAGKDLTEWHNQSMQILVDTGVITQEEMDRTVKAHPRYAPLKRIVGENRKSGRWGKGFANLPSPLRKRLGSDLPVVNPIDAAVQTMAERYTRATKQRVFDAAIQTMKSVRGHGVIGDMIKPTAAPTNFKLEDIAKQLKEIGVPDHVLNALNPLETLTIWQTNLNMDKDGKPIIRHVEHGKPVFYELDTEFYSFATAMDNTQLGGWFKILTVPTKVGKLGWTGINEAFATVNSWRDGLSYISNVKPGTGQQGRALYLPVQALGSYAMAGLHAIDGKPGDPFLEAFNRMGGSLSSGLGLDYSSIETAVRDALADDKKSRLYNLVRSPIRTLKDLMSAPEMVPRLAAFRLSLEGDGWTADKIKAKGIDAIPLTALEKAVAEAHDITVDFRQAGSWGKYINQVVPYFNAPIQGWNKFFRNFKENPYRAWISAGVYVAAGAAYWLARHDDDDYKQQPDWLKYGFWTVTDKNGKPIWRIAKPHGYGIITSGIEAFLNRWYDNDPKAVTGWFQHSAEQFILPYKPATLAPIIEAWANLDHFGRDISPREMQNREGRDRAKPSTSALMRGIANYLHEMTDGSVSISPAKLEHLAQGYSGGMYGRAVNWGRTLTGQPQNEADTPVLGRWRMRGDFSQAMESFYRNQEGIAQRFNSAKDRKDVPAALAREHERMLAFRGLLADIRPLGRGEVDRDKRFNQAEKYMIGIAMVAEGQPPLARYPNPFRASGVPAEVARVRDEWLGAQVRRLTASRPQRGMGESLEHHQQELKEWEVKQEQTRSILRELGVTGETAAAGLRAEADARARSNGTRPGAMTADLSRRLVAVRRVLP